MTKNNKRLLSLDVLRGITVAGMILVNDGYGESFTVLKHSTYHLPTELFWYRFARSKNKYFVSPFITTV